MEGALNKLSTIKKGLFDQKGGTFGLVLLAIGAVFFVAKIGAIVAFVDSLVHLIIVGVIGAAVLYVFLDPKARLAMGTLYMLAIKKIMGTIIKMNPIAILEDTILKMHKSIARVEENMGKLNGVRLELDKKIKEKKEELEECLEKKKVAEKQGKRELAIIQDRQSARLVSLTQDYIDLHTSTEKWYETLSKIAQMASMTVEDAQNEVEAQKERYKMVKSANSAFKSAMSILKGDPDQLAMYNEAFEYINEDIMGKLGEMDRVINSTGGMIDQIDVDKDVYALKGNDILKKYEELGIDALFNKFEALPSKRMDSLMPVQEAVILSSTPATPVETNEKKKYF